MSDSDCLPPTPSSGTSLHWERESIENEWQLDNWALSSTTAGQVGLAMSVEPMGETLILLHLTNRKIVARAR